MYIQLHCKYSLKKLAPLKIILKSVLHPVKLYQLRTYASINDVNDNVEELYIALLAIFYQVLVIGT